MELGELWIDRPEAVARIPSLQVSEETALHLKFFLENGYTIFRRVVPDDVIDVIVSEMTSVSRHPAKYIVRRGGKYLDPADINSLDAGGRVIDIYGVSVAARTAIYQPLVAEFLKAVFGEPAIAMQSLNFEYGSQQAVHQDTAYVVSSKPLSLTAAWIALEDVVPGSGELVYYPGSHRFNHYLFGSESKAWSKSSHGDAAHQQFLKQLHEQAKQRRMRLESFIAKKGDVLIWHADLAHGGAHITNDRTRRSLVVHFCPRSVKPAYVSQVPRQYVELEDPSGNFFSSRHYDLRTMDAQGECKIYYDGGVSKKNASSRPSAPAA